MKKIHPVPRLFFAVAVLSLAVAFGGLVTQQSLGLPAQALVPHPIAFALMFGWVMGVVGVMSAVFTERNSKPPGSMGKTKTMAQLLRNLFLGSKVAGVESRKRGRSRILAVAAGGECGGLTEAAA